MSALVLALLMHAPCNVSNLVVDNVIVSVPDDTYELYFAVGL